VPQRWQNFAPWESAAPQPAQAAPSRAEPQLAQNRPLAGDEQAGQVPAEAVGAVIREN
jgi:hypothetical protein